MGVVAVAAVTACGAGPSSGAATRVSTGPDVLASAYGSTTSAGSADESLSMRISTASGATTTVQAAGSFQWKPLLGSMTETLDTPSGSMMLPIRLVGTDIYVELPSQAASQLGGKRWIKASIAELAGSGGPSQFDPTQELALLSAHAQSVKSQGPATVDGVPTTHYRAVLDLSKAGATSVSQPILSRLEALIGTNLLPVDVWIDHSGRLVQLTMDMTVRSAPQGASSAVVSQFPVAETITVSLSHYGVPVTASPPPADQVSTIDLSQILQGAGL